MTGSQPDLEARSAYLSVSPLMPVRSPFVRRWLLYGVLISLAHFSAVWFFGVIIDEGVVTDRLTSLGSWLTVPGGWLHHAFSRDTRDEFLFSFMVLFCNSALWGFTIAAGVLYSFGRCAGTHSQHENAA